MKIQGLPLPGDTSEHIWPPGWWQCCPSAAWPDLHCLHPGVSAADLLSGHSWGRIHGFGVTTQEKTRAGVWPNVTVPRILNKIV